MNEETRRSAGGFLAGGSEDRPAVAASVMVGSLFLLALQDSLVKLTSGDVSIWQFQAIRACFNLLLIFALSRLVWGTVRLKAQRIWAVILRSMLLAGALLCFFGGIPFLSMAEIAAGLYVFPLFVALLSRLVLGEPVGPRRIAAILVGFLGTLLILKPGTEAFQPIALMPVGAALCYAANILVTRRLCREESPVTLAYGVSIAFLVMGGLGMAVFTGQPLPRLAESWPYLFTGWSVIDGFVVVIIAVCSCLNLTSNIGLAKAYQTAEASWLAPFDYSYLIFATFWGFVFWSDVPGGVTLLGMTMIAGAGAFVAWRERQLSRLSRANFNRRL